MLKYIFLLLLSSISFSQNSNYDFSGMHKFWEIVDILKTNKEPANSEWNELFNTPGYKVLTSGEFTRQFFIENFKLVFMPSKQNELNEALKNGKNLNHLTHFIKVRDNRKIISDQQSKLMANNFSQTAVKRTLEFLPQSNVDQLPPVSFVIFENNGRGSSPIVVDLCASLEWDFMSFLSHEFHHWYRNRQVQINYNKVSEDDEILINALAKIEAEGIADMVDKRDWFTKSSKSISIYAKQFINDVGNSPYVINKMDEYLSGLNSNLKNIKVIGRNILEVLPQQGHTTGYFMASLILEKEGKNEIVKCVGNPFKFIHLYNSAAKKSNNRYPQFSNKSIENLEILEKKFSK